MYNSLGNAGSVCERKGSCGKWTSGFKFKNIEAGEWKDWEVGVKEEVWEGKFQGWILGGLTWGVRRTLIEGF